MKRNLIINKGFFNWDTLIVIFGNTHRGYWEAKAIKVPDYDFTYSTREDEGGGWYGAKIRVTERMTKSFVIVKDSEILGYMINPFHKEHNIKTPLTRFDKYTHKPIIEFANSLNLPFKS